MFKKILLPTDTSESTVQKKAIDIACNQAKQDGAELHLLAVGSAVPSLKGVDEHELKQRLHREAVGLSKEHGITVTSNEVHAFDTGSELKGIIMREIDDTDADLVVMASHIPGFMDYLVSSNAGHTASHAKVSVFVVR